MLALACQSRFDQKTAEAVEKVRSGMFGDVTPNLHPVASLSATSFAVSAPLLWTATPAPPAAEATVIVPLMFRGIEPRRSDESRGGKGCVGRSRSGGWRVAKNKN